MTAEVEKLNLLPYQLGPSEKLSEEEHRVLDGVVLLQHRAVHVVALQEILPEGVEDPALQIIGGVDQRIAKSRDDLLGLDLRQPLVALTLQVGVEAGQRRVRRGLELAQILIGVRLQTRDVSVRLGR